MTVAQGTPRTDKLKIPSEALLLLGSKGVPEQIVKAILILGDHARELERENAALSAQLLAEQQEKSEYILASSESLAARLYESRQTACHWMLKAHEFQEAERVLSAQVVELQQQLVNSTVTRASVPPSVFDSGTALRDLQREYSRIGELIRYKVCGDPSVTIRVPRA